jgi:predicted ATPase/class 3 adenylate cyclase
MDDSPALKFGHFELQARHRRLLRDGEPLPVGARAFDVLLALAERRDRIVTKAELMDLVWAGLVVAENNLQVQVSSLRRLLGSDAIATIPGRGYRFTAQLARNGEGGSSIKQRLAAIMAADVAGYSRVMGADESFTVRAVDAARMVFKTWIESSRGRVIDVAGDSVLALFETATGAVSTALAIQDELRRLSADVPEDRRVRFRIGVHLGDVIEKADGTVYGDGVNIAARLEGLAEPGGIVISDSVRGAVKGKVDASFLDQGEQAVKNIADPLRGFKVISGSQAPTVSRLVEGESSADSIHDSAHPSAVGASEPSDLERFTPPGAPRTLFGREDDLVALDQLLAQHRHVTVLGAGGIGKSSLALAAAHARCHAQRDGAAWADLSSISEPALVCAVVARALELPVASGDHQLPALVAGLKSLDVLLVLDNAEHLIDEVARLSSTIATDAPGVQLLVTSQVVLKVERERVFRLGPLAIPEPGTSAHDAMGYGAIELFVDQAQAADPRFRVTDENVGSVIELCRHLDGLALAIKLAAVRLPLFGLRGLEQRLGDRLKLLADASRSAPTRQQTLRAALDWSYGLLSAEEQTTFRQLGVFAGACGFSLDLARAVADEDGQDEWAVIEHVSVLLDHSLVVDDGADPPRYRLLESARDYALRQLAERHELDAAEGRFARAMSSVMERFDEARWTTREIALMSTFARELDNVRLAIGWSLEHDPRLAIALVAASSSFYLLLGLTHEHERYAEVLEPLVVSSDAVDDITARYWLARAVAEAQSGFPSARAGERAVSLFRTLGDERGVAASLCCLGVVQVYSVAQWSAIRAEMDSLAPEAWPVRTKVWRFLAEAAMHNTQGRFDEALSVAEAGLVFARSKGMLNAVTGLTRYAIRAELALGRLDDALSRSREQIADECRWRGRALEVTLGTHAEVLTRQGRCPEARLALAEFFEASRRTGWHRFGQFGSVLVELALHEQRYSRAASLLGYARAAWGRQNTQRRCAELLAALEAVLDAETLERLLAKGNALDEEAVCALTLETGGCG